MSSNLGSSAWLKKHKKNTSSSSSIPKPGSQSTQFNLTSDNGILDYLLHLARPDLAQLESASKFEEHAIETFIQKVKTGSRDSGDRTSSGNQQLDRQASAAADQRVSMSRESRPIRSEMGGAEAARSSIDRGEDEIAPPQQDLVSPMRLLQVQQRRTGLRSQLPTQVRPHAERLF